MRTAETTEFSTRIAVFSKPDDAHELADVLTEELGLHPTDAMHEAHSTPCVLTPRLTSANAERVVTAIHKLGLRAEPISLDELREFEDIHTDHHVACRQLGLEILDLLGQPAERIPWDDLKVLSVGETPAESSHHQLAGEFTIISSARRPQDINSDIPAHTLELWIVCRHPARVCRLDASKLNFESLAERKTNSMHINLRLLLKDIVRHASNAHLTPATREFLDHDKLTRFKSAEQLLNVTQLHLLMTHRLRPAMP
jgi:hypothetical protein